MVLLIKVDLEVVTYKIQVVFISDFEVGFELVIENHNTWFKIFKEKTKNNTFKIISKVFEHLVIKLIILIVLSILDNDFAVSNCNN